MVATPRPASTVVLIDGHSRVYLTKRPESMKFMGGFHVFPGGAVEREDNEIGENTIMNVPEHSTSLPYYITAAREVFEEVGILLGIKEEGTSIRLPKEKLKKYRQNLLDGKLSFGELLKQEKLFLDLQCLTYFGQIITPEEMPIRFDTSFFLAQLPEGQIPEPNQTEIDEALWMKPEEALSSYQKKRMKLAPPTIISLQTIIDHQNGGELMMSVTRDDLLKLLKNQ